MLVEDDLAVMVEGESGEYLCALLAILLRTASPTLADLPHSFQAGSICTAGEFFATLSADLAHLSTRAGFWRLEDKIGCSLEEIHSRGVVPQWKEKLKFSMERFFQKMKVDKPVQRNNVSSTCAGRRAKLTSPSQYFFQIDDQVYWSDKTNGPEEIFDQGAKGPNPEKLAASTDPNWIEPKPTVE